MIAALLLALAFYRYRANADDAPAQHLERIGTWLAVVSFLAAAFFLWIYAGHCADASAASAAMEAESTAQLAREHALSTALAARAGWSAIIALIL